ncbi:hypothetical protein SLS62_003817 [Diatrype stigma]|uniref:Uncharacterized protein n=1 Tax=Diatrype stigma TaxID=117547 RepID=A0AAN9URW4_9PEZI
MPDNKDWKPYTVPYTGGGASPSGTVFSSSPPEGRILASGGSGGGVLDPERNGSSSSSSSRPVGAEHQGPLPQAQVQTHLNLPAGTFSRAPDHPKSPATQKREAEQVRKSCSGQENLN